MSECSHETDRARYTVSARLVKSLLYFASSKGLDAEALCLSSGISIENLEDEYGRVSIHKEQALWREVASQLARPVHGREVIEFIPYGYLGLPELLFSTAPTVRNAIEVVVDFIPLIRDGLSVRLTQSAQGCRLSYCFGEPLSALEGHAMASFASGLNALISKYIGVTLGEPLASLTDSANHGDRGRAHVDPYGAENFFLMIPSALLERSLPTAAPQLHVLLRAHASEVLQKKRDDSVLFSKIRHAMVLELKEGHLTLKGVASLLQMSERSLQRQIAKHGTTFGELRAHIRQDLVQQYLQDSGLTIAEISWRLGYASPQAFHRAFQDWFGLSPSTWRKQHHVKLDVLSEE